MSKHINPTEQAMSEQELFSKVMDMLPLKAPQVSLDQLLQRGQADDALARGV